MELVAAKCPSCGADIQVPNNKDFAFCTFCGSNVKVRESVIMKSDVDIDNLVNLGNVELQAKDYDEAMDYFARVLEVDGKNSKAWLGRGHATIRKSSNDSKNWEEALVYFENAIDNSRENVKDELRKSIVGEFTGRKYYLGHLDFLGKVVKLHPNKELLLSLITLLDILEADAARAGNELTPERKQMKSDAHTSMKENFPAAYELYLKEAEQNAQERASGNTDEALIEKKKKELFSVKRLMSDLFSTTLLNVIITAVIILIFDSLEVSGTGRFIVIFLVLTAFMNLAVFMNKRRELKSFRQQLSWKNPFKNMVQ